MKFYFLYLFAVLLILPSASVATKENVCLAFSGGGSRSAWMTYNSLKVLDKKYNIKQVAAISGGTWGTALYYAHKNKGKFIDKIPNEFGLKGTKFFGAERAGKSYIMALRGFLGGAGWKDLKNTPRLKFVMAGTRDKRFNPVEKFINFCFMDKIKNKVNLNCPSFKLNLPKSALHYKYKDLVDKGSLAGTLYRCGSAIEIIKTANRLQKKITTNFDYCKNEKADKIDTFLDAGNWYNIPYFAFKNCKKVIAFDFGAHKDCGKKELNNFVEWCNSNNKCCRFKKALKINAHSFVQRKIYFNNKIVTMHYPSKNGNCKYINKWGTTKLLQKNKAILKEFKDVAVNIAKNFS